MSNLNLFGKEWANIVFENRNKLYGAYKLRQESGRNTFLALAIGIGSLALIFGSSYLYASKNEAHIVVINLDNENPMIPTDVLANEKPEPEKNIPETPIVDEVLTEEKVEASARTSVQKELDFREMVATEDPQVINEDLTAQNDFTDDIQAGQSNHDADLENGVLKNTGAQTGEAQAGIDGKLPGNAVGNTTEDFGNSVFKVVQQKAAPNEGFQKFYDRFSRKFSAKTLDANVNEIVVKLRFVVEKDGSFTDIQVLDDKLGLGEEAKRVLQSMPHWKPAAHNGRTVRSMFTLPIKIRINN